MVQDWDSGQRRYRETPLVHRALLYKVRARGRDKYNRSPIGSHISAQSRKHSRAPITSLILGYNATPPGTIHCSSLVLTVVLIKILLSHSQTHSGYGASNPDNLRRHCTSIITTSRRVRATSLPHPQMFF